MKPVFRQLVVAFEAAAAFGRLCVETDDIVDKLLNPKAAAFGRLCVETTTVTAPPSWAPAAAFGRLCVETQNVNESG